MHVGSDNHMITFVIIFFLPLTQNHKSHWTCKCLGFWRSAFKNTHLLGYSTCHQVFIAWWGKAITWSQYTQWWNAVSQSRVPKWTLQPKRCQMSILVSHQVFLDILGVQDPFEGSCGPKVGLKIPAPSLEHFYHHHPLDFFLCQMIYFFSCEVCT